jgi:hypothetical protein
MRTAELIVWGGVVGLLAVAFWKWSQVDTSIDPTTGGVRIPAGTVYGPPAPTDSLAEGLQ